MNVHGTRATGGIRSCASVGSSVLVVLLTTCCPAQQADQVPAEATGQTSAIEDDASLVPLPRVVPAPKANPTTEAKVALGKQLFFDPRLSGDNSMSCATCHDPAKAFGDGQPVATGHRGKRLDRNTQTCLNVGFYAELFWDGRARSLEEQALVPIEAPNEMNQDLTVLEQELTAIPAYSRKFDELFGRAPHRDDIARALAAYQRTLVSAPSPFDRYLLGDESALSDEAKQGLELFVGAAGCVECHRGPLLSDQQYYRLRPTQDLGREKVTGRRQDRRRFRTPSLRNVAETGPYMHDGKLKTLDEVVTYYYREIPSSGPDGWLPDTDALVGQSYSEIPLIVAFLKSLSGALPETTAPELPPDASDR